MCIRDRGHHGQGSYCIEKDAEIRDNDQTMLKEGMISHVKGQQQRQENEAARPSVTDATHGIDPAAASQLRGSVAHAASPLQTHSTELKDLPSMV